MSEWWTYRPSDFLMFSARSYGRLVENYNSEFWPAQPVLVLLTVALVLLVARDPRRWVRPAMVLLAAAWAWIAWAFHWERFATINTAAAWFAGAFALQAVLLLAIAAWPGGAAANATLAQAPVRRPPPRTRTGGLALALLAVLAYPLLAPAVGRGWAEAEVAALLPDPTALLTLGLLLATPLRGRVIASMIPALALMVGWTTATLLWA